jgi:hypothetical protein
MKFFKDDTQTPESGCFNANSSKTGYQIRRRFFGVPALVWSIFYDSNSADM